MDALDGRTKLLAAGALALLVVGVVALRELEGAPASERMTVPSVADVQRPQVVAALSSPPAPVTLPPPEAWSPDDSSDVVAKRYALADDLRAFYDRALQTGGSAHLMFAQDALMRCMRVARQGLVGAEQSFATREWPDGLGRERREGHRRWISPCKDFELRPPPPGEFRRVFRLILDTPGLHGDAARIGATIIQGEPRDDIKELLRAIVESGDAYLVGSFGMGAAIARFGPFSDDGTAQGRDSNRRLVEEERAWMLAGCALGADCGRGSTPWYTACIESGDCGENNAQAAAIAKLGPEALPAVLRRRDEIVAAVRARDWSALGLEPS